MWVFSRLSWLSSQFGNFLLLKEPWCLVSTLLCPKPNSTESKEGKFPQQSNFGESKPFYLQAVTLQLGEAEPEKKIFLISCHFLACEAPWCLVCCGAGFLIFLHKKLLDLAAHQIPCDQRPAGECPLALHRCWSRQRTCWRENQWRNEGPHPLRTHGKRDKCHTKLQRPRLQQNCCLKCVCPCFFLSPPGLLFLEGQMEFARKCQVLLCFSQRLFCFPHRRGWVFNDNSKPKTV